MTTIQELTNDTTPKIKRQIQESLDYIKEKNKKLVKLLKHTNFLEKELTSFLDEKIQIFLSKEEYNSLKENHYINIASSRKDAEEKFTRNYKTQEKLSEYDDSIKLDENWTPCYDENTLDLIAIFKGLKGKKYKDIIKEYDNRMYDLGADVIQSRLEYTDLRHVYRTSNLEHIEKLAKIDNYTLDDEDKKLIDEIEEVISEARGFVVEIFKSKADFVVNIKREQREDNFIYILDITPKKYYDLVTHRKLKEIKNNIIPTGVVVGTDKPYKSVLSMYDYQDGEIFINDPNYEKGVTEFITNNKSGDYVIITSRSDIGYYLPRNISSFDNRVMLSVGNVILANYLSLNGYDDLKKLTEEDIKILSTVTLETSSEELGKLVYKGESLNKQQKENILESIDIATHVGYTYDATHEEHRDLTVRSRSGHFIDGKIETVRKNGKIIRDGIIIIGLPLPLLYSLEHGQVTTIPKKIYVNSPLPRTPQNIAIENYIYNDLNHRGKYGHFEFKVSTMLQDLGIDRNKTRAIKSLVIFLDYLQKSKYIVGYEARDSKKLILKNKEDLVKDNTPRRQNLENKTDNITIYKSELTEIEEKALEEERAKMKAKSIVKKEEAKKRK